MITDGNWQPIAEMAVLQQRAAMLRTIRKFFLKRLVLEVETPVLSCSTTCDPFIDSFVTDFQGQDYFLQTSPELPMKRLLASGSGPIYQICKVFRQGESGSKHNPEFSLLEWYRPGYDLLQLMQEMDDLLRELMAEITLSPSCFYSYQECFEKFLSINPHNVDIDELYRCAREHNLHRVLERDEAKDRWLELLMSHIIEPQLGGTREQPCISFVYDYPASQAALAKIEKNSQGVPVARRFEVYVASMELANGFYELQDSQEQQRRFEWENQQRLAMGKNTIPMDSNFLGALQHGLPDCSGVALGLDRLLMLLTAKNSIDEVLTFPIAGA